MDFGKAVTYPFDDEDWLKKLGLGLIIGLIPIVQFALSGWQVRLIKSVKDNEAKPLPAWEDFGGHFMRGLLVTVAGLIYQLPVLIFACVAAIVAGGAGGLAGQVGDNGSAANAVGPVVSIVLACCGCIALIYAIIAFAALWGGLVRFAETETFSTFMEFGTNFGLVRNNLSLFLMAVLYVFAAALILSVVSSVTLGLGSLITPIVITYFSGHILGQLSQQLGSEGMAAAPAA